MPSNNNNSTFDFTKIFDWKLEQEPTNTVASKKDKTIDASSLGAKALAAATGLPVEVVEDPRFKPSLKNPKWNEYDETIKKEVAFYNKKFADVANFHRLDWRYVKAMVWTEVMAGPTGNPTEWQKRPMQIGVIKGGKEDPGYKVVRDAGRDEGADKVVEEELKKKIQKRENVIGTLNIRVGIAYLYIKCVDGVREDRNIVVDPTILTTTVQAGEGFEAIAARVGTTSENIARNNPELDSTKLKPNKDIIKYQHAKKDRFISKWKDDWWTAIKAYNSKDPQKGDKEYIPKVWKAYQIIVSRTPLETIEEVSSKSDKSIPTKLP